MGQHIANHQVDPISGFIESPAYSYAFTAEKKQRFLEFIAENPLAHWRACKTIGVDWHTFQRHLEIDASFRESLQALKRASVEKIEERVMSQAVSNENPTWAIFALKAHKPEVYNPTSKSEVSHNVSIEIKGLESFNNRHEAIEADIVKEVNRIENNEYNAFNSDEDSKSVDV